MCSDKKNVCFITPIYNQTVDISNKKVQAEAHIKYTENTQKMPFRFQANENLVNITSTHYTSKRLIYDRINQKDSIVGEEVKIDLKTVKNQINLKHLHLFIIIDHRVIYYYIYSNF